MSEDDPGHATLRAVEGVVELARAEVRLAVSEARAAGERFFATLAVTALALFFAAVAFVVGVLSPVLWTFRPQATLVSVAIAVAFALPTSLVAALRWRSHRALRLGTPSRNPPEPSSLVPNPQGPEHAVER